MSSQYIHPDNAANEVAEEFQPARDGDQAADPLRPLEPRDADDDRGRYDRHDGDDARVGLDADRDGDLRDRDAGDRDLRDGDLREGALTGDDDRRADEIRSDERRDTDGPVVDLDRQGADTPVEEQSADDKYIDVIDGRPETLGYETQDGPPADRR